MKKKKILFNFSNFIIPLNISVFLTRTKSGLIAGFLFFFLLYIINAIVGTNEVPDSTKTWASLSSHAAMAFSADTFLIAEVDYNYFKKIKEKLPIL